MIQSITAEVFEVPLKGAFATARDKLARMVTRPVSITVSLGKATFTGESVPVEYVTGETQESVLDAVARARPDLLGCDVRELDTLVARLKEILPESPSARAGIEMALWKAHGALLRMPLRQLFGGAVDSVETDITVPIVDDAIDRAKEAWLDGFRRFKIKVGNGDIEADLNRVVAVHLAAPESMLRIDANQGFTSEEALQFIDRVLHAGVRIELIEQPVPKEDLESLDRVAAESPVPVLADEAVKSPDEARRVVQTSVHGINVKLMKSGISGALEIIDIAIAAGKQLMIGCMLETRRGISASLALACGTGAFDYVDLDSHLLLAEEGQNLYFDQTGPHLRIREA